MTAANQWEADGRAKKVDALIPVVLDGMAKLVMVHGPLTSETVGAVLRGLPAKTWAAMAKDAQIKPPSEKTIEAVIAAIEVKYSDAEGGETEGYEPGEEWD